MSISEYRDIEYKMIDKFAEMNRYVLHVTQVINRCHKDILFSNVSRYFNIPTIRHVYSLMGTAVHKFIKDYIDGKHTDIQEYYDGISDYGKFKKSIDNFIKWYNDFNISERETHTEISSSKVINIDDIDIILVGTADLIMDNSSGYTIVDFKTSKTTSMIINYEKQIGGYKKLFGDKFNINNGSVLILGSRNYIYRTIDIDYGLSEFEKDLKVAIDDILFMRENKVAIPNLSFRCVFCDFRSFCMGDEIRR